ncbi:MAG: hypothetical protein JXO48_05620 [Deltaproteobacteria bacterium]|nr:hypothetical protein [Deltaproteobacteria bacterium]
MGSLLAVDLGVRAGLALYGGDGRLRWYRSHNFGSVQRLRKGVSRVLSDVPDLEWVIVEGGGDLAGIWEREAQRRNVSFLTVPAEIWRERFLLPREQRSRVLAKTHAEVMARRIIAWSGTKRPTSLRHDAAEAIIVGLWGVLEVGLLDQLPSQLRR